MNIGKNLNFDIYFEFVVSFNGSYLAKKTSLDVLSIVIRKGISKWFGFEVLFQLVTRAIRKEHPTSPYRRKT